MKSDGETTPRLLPLEIIGKNTGDVEALHSYVLRLARLHSVTPSYLFEVIARRAGRHSELRPGDRITAVVGPQLDRPRPAEHSVVPLLTTMASECEIALKNSTFMFLSKALSRTVNCYSRFSKWCPGCVADQSLEGVPVHHKLVWSFSAVKACHVHRMGLTNRCLECGARPLGGPAYADSCRACGTRFDRVHASTRVAVAHEEYALDLVELVDSSMFRTGDYQVGAIKSFIHRLVCYVWLEKRERYRFEGLPRHEFMTYLRREHPPTLSMVRRTSARLGLPIDSLLHPWGPYTRDFFLPEHAPPSV